NPARAGLIVALRKSEFDGFRPIVMTSTCANEGFRSHNWRCWLRESGRIRRIRFCAARYSVQPCCMFSTLENPFESPFFSPSHFFCNSVCFFLLEEAKTHFHKKMTHSG